MTTVYLYLLSALIACLITAGSLPFLHRFLATFFLDKPNHLKKHQRAVPVLGGCAVLLGLPARLCAKAKGEQFLPFFKIGHRLQILLAATRLYPKEAHAPKNRLKTKTVIFFIFSSFLYW